MKSFCYKGVEYRSLAECCKAVKVSYQKVRRLCRHYVRANQDPALAVSWCIGEVVLAGTETKTEKYKIDLARGCERKARFRERNAEELKKRRNL